jgi:lipoprotein-releasing system ATP-binding protein
VDSAASTVATAVAPTLRLEGVTKSFAIGKPAEVEVLHGIDLTLRRGEFAALIGPSGSGKSTLLNLIGLLDQPTRGKLFIEGLETEHLADDAMTRLRGRSIGFVFQHHHLLPEFTALDNVAMPLAIRRMGLAQARERAGDALASVGLSGRVQHHPTELSGGERQRTAIARAIVTRPACVLADEPTGNLDRDTARAVFGVFVDLAQQNRTSVIIVTHDPELAARCHRVLRLEHGQLQPA